ncbi:MAG: retropepsin-like aspartic protease [Blastocatellia bacterium]
MNRYNDQYAPAAPFSLITLKNIETSETIRDVPMLLDTGSDITLLPLTHCRRIGIEVSEENTLDLFGFDGSTSKGLYVRLELQFGGKQFRGNFVAYDQAEGILGRNILNEFSLLLDGPNLSWDTINALIK